MAKEDVKEEDEVLRLHQDDIRAAKESIPVWIKVVIGVGLAAAAIGATARSGGEKAGAHTAQVDSHETRITANAAEIKILDARQDKHDVTTAEIKRDYKTLLDGQSEIKQDFKGFEQFLRQYDFEKKEP